jgi:plastocyanin
VKRRRYQIATVVAVAAFSALFAVLPSKGAGREIKMVGFQFRPSTFTVRAGEAVTFVNETKLTHTATCKGCPQDTGDVQPGTIHTLTFTRAGTFELFCRYHQDRGMIAGVTVRP